MKLHYLDPLIVFLGLWIFFLSAITLKVIITNPIYSDMKTPDSIRELR